MKSSTPFDAVAHMSVRVRPRPRAVGGAVLLEFALLSLVLYVLLAAVLTLGRGVLVGQVAQDAARVAARELALTPLPAGVDFDTALAQPEVMARVFDPRWLVVDVDDPDNPETLAVESDVDELMATLPPVNRALRPLMIFDRPVLGGVPRRLMRMPGALLGDATSFTGLTVQVPLVRARDGVTGTETDLRWVRVLEEVRPDPLDPTTGSFDATVAGGGVVALRLNVPFQTDAFAGYTSSPDGLFEPNGSTPVLADDAAAVASASPLDGANFLPELDVLGDDAPGSRAYLGQTGLGSLFVQDSQVRPFRRVISAQAVFRREVLLP